MQHLNNETLARLVDEAASHDESLHLQACARCSTDLDELRAQTRALAELPDLAPSQLVWPRLQKRLGEEGLIRPRRQPRVWWSHAPLRMAAALALFLLGGVAGMAVTRGEGRPDLAGAGAPVEERGQLTVEEAGRVLQEREAAYLAALAEYAELTGTWPVVDPGARLLALEGIVLTTRAALEEAPADPVINGYHLAALGQREATLRQIALQMQDPWF